MWPRLKAFLHALYHYGIYVVAVAVIVVSVAALGFKFWFMPNVDRFKPLVESSASQALGMPVVLGRLEAGWAGINPQLTLRDLRVAAKSSAPLTLPRVDATLSWWSLALLEPRLSNLTLDQPQLAIWRDRAGVIYVAGIAVNVPSKPSPFPDWVLRQPSIVVRDARVTWQDEKLASPPVRFDQVRLYLRNRFGHHRFAGIALPTAAAGRVELRGNLTGKSVQQADSWSGQLYARVDDARFDTWGRWVPWAQQAVRSGHGAMRFWLDLERGQVRSLTGDTRLAGVAINVSGAEPLPDLAFQSLAGHVGWKRDLDRKGVVSNHHFFVENLRFAIAGETPSEPASVRIELTPDGSGGFKSVTAAAKNLRLEALTALTGALPLPRRGHDLIAALNPRGLVENVSGHWGGVHDYSFKLKVRDAGMNAYGTLPGFTGLSARIEADQSSGSAELNGRDMVLTLDRVFRQPLEFKQLDSHATWKTENGVTHLKIADTTFNNQDLVGSAEGSIELPATGKPRVDITGHLSHGKATAVYRYLPHAVGHNAYEWVKRGVIGGTSDDTRLVLKGDLARFPFDKGGGDFKVSVKMVNGLLDYGVGWPRIDGINGMLVFHDKSMTITADTGRILGARLGPVRVHIPDIHSSIEEILEVDGRASGRTQDFLDFIRQSPVNRHTGGFTEKMQAVGNGDLALSLRLPLRRLDASTLAGVYTLEDNRIDLGGDLPDLEQVGGRFSFTDTTLQARDVKTRVLGLPATLTIDSSSGGQVHARMTGRATAEALRPYLPAGIGHLVGGAADWQADVRMAHHQNEIQVTSDLAGLSIRLPPPLRKIAAQVVPLTITRTPGDLRESVVKVRYGNLLAARAELPVAGPAWISLRLAQGEAPAPREAGISVSGALHSLDLDTWRALNLAGSGTEEGPQLRDLSLSLGELRVAGRVLHDTHVGVRPAGQGWKVALAGRELAGDILTVPEGQGTRVIANFKRLSIPAVAEDALPGDVGDQAADALSGLELNAQNFSWQGRDLGELHLRLAPDKLGYVLERVSLATPEGRLVGSGRVARQARRPTNLKLALDSPDLGKFLARIGYPGNLRGGEVKVDGEVDWMGGIEDFKVDNLNGHLQVGMKKGQFLKVKPGVGKLLGILSLQALPRRIALDFRDVFSDGFAFDEIAGDVHLERGSAYAKDLKMNGPAAKVAMSGVVNLMQETQNLRVNIQPRLEDTLAVAGALVGGPVVGIGTLIANKLLKNPIGQAVSFDYSVAGTWAEPVVTRIKRAPAAVQETP